MNLSLPTSHKQNVWNGLKELTVRSDLTPTRDHLPFLLTILYTTAHKLKGEVWFWSLVRVKIWTSNFSILCYPLGGFRVTHVCTDWHVSIQAAAVQTGWDSVVMTRDWIWTFPVGNLVPSPRQVPRKTNQAHKVCLSVCVCAAMCISVCLV